MANRLSIFLRLVEPLVVAVAGCWLLLAGGCADYSKNAPVYRENVALSNQNAQLQEQVKTLRQQVSDLKEQLAAQMPRIPTLEPDRLAELFTVDSINITGDTRSTHIGGAEKLNGFRVFVKTLMSDGQALPASGTFTIEAFDLALQNGTQRIGRWVFTPEESKQDWYGMFGLNCFAFDCPWQIPPAHRDITFHVRFVDALTGRVFTSQMPVKIDLTDPSDSE
ncbi:MAG TPA: hypothetical protein VMG59_11310 [Phycisphaerae bacterium]|nr:hypothetical protein [Phycisphaerae bacterium]